MTLILSNAYSGVFYSILTIPEYDPPVDTLGDLMKLVKSDKVTIISSANVHHDFEHAGPDNEVYYKIGQHLRR